MKNTAFFSPEKPRKLSESMREDHCFPWKFHQITCAKMKLVHETKKLKTPLKTFRFDKILKISAMKLFSLAVERFEKVPLNRKYDSEKSEKFP